MRPRQSLLAAPLLPAVLLLAALLLAGCGSAPPPQVTFAAAGQSARTAPAQFCDMKVTHCDANPAAQAVLRVPPGTPLQVSVPTEVAAAPWQVVFSYRDRSGARTRGRSQVFPPGSPSSWTLTLPDPTAQLETAEVQQFGAALTQGPDGVGFTTRGTWVLSVDDRAG